LLWRFSRPHTIVGSFFSITALWFIAIGYYSSFDLNGAVWQVYLLTLLSALACNIFITGLNQLTDVAIDRVNKPGLPLASGELSLRNGRLIVIASLAVALIAAGLAGWFLLLLIAIICLVGAMYSLPPLRLKRHHGSAAFSIVLVRGFFVNVGMMAHFAHSLTGQWQFPWHIMPLTLFVIGFSLGIAWFKDIPDTRGDEAFDIKTLAVVTSARQAFVRGVVLVALSYIVVILCAWQGWRVPKGNGWLVATHLLLLGIFLFMSWRLNVGNLRQVRRFYIAFWVLFFVEYIVYPIAYAI
jgi:homogentisate phytyltransferase/homogentisate geranylgeranyltransferase